MISNDQLLTTFIKLEGVTWWHKCIDVSPPKQYFNKSSWLKISRTNGYFLNWFLYLKHSDYKGLHNFNRTLVIKTAGQL